MKRSMLALLAMLLAAACTAEGNVDLTQVADVQVEVQGTPFVVVVGTATGEGLARSTVYSTPLPAPAGAPRPQDASSDAQMLLLGEWKGDGSRQFEISNLRAGPLVFWWTHQAATVAGDSFQVDIEWPAQGGGAAGHFRSVYPSGPDHANRVLRRTAPVTVSILAPDDTEWQMWAGAAQER